jgi:hypothetical protein
MVGSHPPFFLKAPPLLTAEHHFAMNVFSGAPAQADTEETFIINNYLITKFTSKEG